MPEPATLEERLQKLVEDHERRLRHLESLECPRIPGPDDWWPVPSEQIILDNNRISLLGPLAVVSVTPNFTLIAGSPITLTLEEPGYIWVWYRAVVVTNNIYRRFHYDVAIFQDGAQLGQVAQFGSLNPAFDTTVPVYDRSDLLAAGPHTIDLRACVLHAGDTATFYFIVGFAFYTRAA